MKCRLICLTILTLSFLLYCDDETSQYGKMTGILGNGHVEINGVEESDPQESIYVRKVGFGDKTIVLIPGNNTSGAVFDAIMNLFRAIESYNSTYTVYTFDYRGSGLSSYNKKITALKDFALDFEKVMKKIEGFPATGVTLVGYSMGFAVSLEMVIANPERYANVVALAGIGTRGYRTSFSAGSAGTDPLGNTYAPGDWVPVTDLNEGLVATEFNQRTWRNETFSFEGISFIWDFLVLNDTLDFDPVSFTMGDDSFKSTKIYEDQIEDVLSIQYMPESLYYSHAFNVSQSDVSYTNTGYGGTVTIPGDGRLADTFNGKNVLLIKAASDLINWRGDVLIYDNYTATSKYDLKQAGGTVTAILVDADQNYDHGFPTVQPLSTIKIIDLFISGTLNSTTAADALGATIQYYDHSETDFETDIFTGL